MITNDYSKTGVLLYVKHYTNQVSEWQGPLTLADGKQLRMQAKHIKGVKYDIDVLSPTEAWKKVTHFELPVFEDQRKQDVYVPNIGTLRAYIGKTKSNDAWCIRFVILDEKGRSPAPRPE